MSKQIYNSRFGHRPLSDRGDGDIPAPYAEGDVVFIPLGCFAISSGRVSTGPGMYRVVAAFSIGEGDEWYFRVSKMTPNERGDRWSTDLECSGRLHVLPGTADYTAAWQTVYTADKNGLAAREIAVTNMRHGLIKADKS